MDNRDSETVRLLFEYLTELTNRGWPPPVQLEIQEASEKLNPGMQGAERDLKTIKIKWSPESAARAIKPSSLPRVLAWVGKKILPASKWLIKEVPREMLRALIRKEVSGGQLPPPL
jgi:hypothetical protein